ncbi:MAG: hypothetical protein ABIE74_07335 [Pseudomonadota bacterium]
MRYFLFMLILLIAIPLQSFATDEDETCPPSYFSDPGKHRDTPRNFNRPTRGVEDRHCDVKHEKLIKHLSANVEFDFLSKYVWRGLASSKGFVWQPSATLEFYGFGTTIWGNFVLNDEANQGQFNEIDFIPYYSTEFHKLSITPLAVIIYYPNKNVNSLDYSNKSSVEFRLNLSYPIWKYFDIFTLFAVNAYGTRGSIWFDFGSGFHYDLLEQLMLHTSILLGVGDKRFNKNHIADVGTKLNLFEYDLSLTWKAWKGLSVIPNLSITTIIAPSLRRATTDPNNFVGGVDLKYDF